MLIRACVMLIGCMQYALDSVGMALACRRRVLVLVALWIPCPG